MDTAFDSYRDRYDHIALHREDGVLELRLHSDGGEVVWGLAPHAELADCLHEAGQDPDTRVIIITGTGDAFIDRIELGGGSIDAHGWERIRAKGTQLVMNHLDVEVPLIAAVNGPASIHAELALLCDVVLAANHATFRDRPHLGNGVVPGDSAHIVWPLLLGHTRGRYLLLTEQELTAEQAREYGAVNEVLPAAQLLPRAWELARRIAAKPPLAIRYTRLAIIAELRRIIDGQLRYGLALEGLAATAHWPDRFQ